MKKSIKTQGACALAILGLGLLSSLFAGCSIVAPPPPPCNCTCNCDHGESGYCSTDTAGTQACENHCVKIGTLQDMCHDSSVVPPSPVVPPPPPCPAGEVLATYQFCETCSDTPQVIEKQFPVTACSQSDAQDLADKMLDGEDCSAEVCQGD